MSDLQRCFGRRSDKTTPKQGRRETVWAPVPNLKGERLGKPKRSQRPMSAGHDIAPIGVGSKKGRLGKISEAPRGVGPAIKPGPELGKAVECRVERQVPVKFCGAKKVSLISGLQGKTRLVTETNSYRRGAWNQNFEPDQRSGLS